MIDCFFRDDSAFDEEGQHLEKIGEPRVPADPADRLAGITDFTRTPRSGGRLPREFAEERGIKAGQVFHPARMAVSGKTKGRAGLFEMMEVLGRERVVARMRRAING